MISSQTGVSQSRNVRRLQRRIEFYYTAGASLDVLSIATITVDAWEQAVFTMDVISETASSTKSASDQRMQDHLVANLKTGDGVANCVDPAGILVANGVGKLDVRLLGPLTLEDV